MKPQTKAFVQRYSNDERKRRRRTWTHEEQKGGEEVEEEPASSEERHLNAGDVVIHKKKNVSFKNNWKN